MKNSSVKLVLIKNAFANLVRGGTSALVALALPPFLTRSMSPEAFGAWALVLQLGAYVGFLDFGIQTAVSRFVAHASERNDFDQRDRIVNTSLAFLATSGLVAWIGALVFSAFLPGVFKQLPHELVKQVQVAFVLVAGSLAVGLPASVFIGIFVGLQQNAIPATIIGLSKAISAVLVIAVAWHHGTLIQMAAVVTVTNLASYGIQWFVCRRRVPDIQYAWKNVTRSAGRELVDYCFSLTVWAIGLLLVTGLDLSIVGYYRFSDVAYYSIAATIVTFLAGFYNAIISPMMPAAAVMHARGDREQLVRMILLTTRYGMALLLLTGLPLILWIHPLLKLWVGPNYSAHTAAIAQILILANMLRLWITPYVVAMIGSGDQRLIVLTPLLEGVSNITLSLIAGYYLGALGVAIGTFLGTIIGLAGMLFYNMPRTSIQFDILQFVRVSLVRPCISAVPVIVAMLVAHFRTEREPFVEHSLRSIALLFSFVLLWVLGFSQSERQNISSRLAAKFRP